MNAPKKIDHYSLKNAPLPFKALATAGIVFSLAVLAWAWYVALGVLKTNRPSEFCVLLGDDLWALAHGKTNLFVMIFFFQACGYAGMLATALALFRRTALRRRMKLVAGAVAMIIVTLNELVWLTAPFLRVSQQSAGYIGLASAAALVLLTIVPLVQMWFPARWKNAKPARVVIVGGGFAGLYAAMGLDGTLGHHKELEVVLIDRKNFFLFPPLLPSAAVGTIETRQVTYSYRRIFETTNIRYEKATVLGVDPVAKIVRMHIPLEEDGHEKKNATTTELSYDYLVLAPGAVNQTFGTKGAEEHAFFVKELTDAMKIRNRIIDCFERAAVIKEERIRRELLRFAVVGGGPTGIEIATEIHDLIHEVLLRRYPEIDPSWPEVSIIQAGAQILPGWPEKVVRLTTAQLKKLGVKTILNNRVLEVKADAVVLKEGPPVQSRTTIWCAGVQPSPLLKACGMPLDKSGRVGVDDFLRVPGYENVFAMGDAATCIDQKSQKPLPPLGQVAFQQGDHLAKNLVRVLRGEPLLPFRYFNFGALVSVGEHYAAVDLLGIKLSGFIGWFVWRTLYLGKIIGFSNKLRIVIDWTLDLLIERSIAQLQERPIALAKPEQMPETVA